MDEIVISGLKEVQERLERLSPDLGRRAMGKALSAAGKIIATEVQARAPKRTGELALNVIAKGKDSASGGYIRIGIAYHKKRSLRSRRPGKVPSSQDPGVYVKFLEYGTRKMAARPFMRPAFDSKKAEAVQVFADTLRDFVERAEHK